MNESNKNSGPLRTDAARGLPRVWGALSIGFTALVTGARTIPLGDNGALWRDLAARTAGRGAGAEQDARGR